VFFQQIAVLISSRPFGYELVNNSGINVILNSYDVSEYLKISPGGIEVILNYELEIAMNIRGYSK
jgi:hypothetical protein